MDDTQNMGGFELEANESVTLLVRKHWAFLAVRFLPPLFFAFAPIIVLVAYTGQLPNGPERFVFGVWWIIVWLGTFGQVTRYYLNAWIITNTRIIDIQQPGFFRRQISSFLLDRVQDVTTQVNGVLATAIGFGTLSVETAGRDERFLMTGVPDPEGVRDLIMREVSELHAGASVAVHADGL